MISYHGTSTSDAAHIVAGNVSVSLGGGELGRGFYTGEQLHLAKAWAFNRFGDKARNVIEFDVPDPEFFALKVGPLDGREATLMRGHIRNRDETRTYLFGYDVVWSQIVGSTSVNGDQYKWESDKSEKLLNGTPCSRRVI
jgi:hypothetical protein